MQRSRLFNATLSLVPANHRFKLRWMISYEMRLTILFTNGTNDYGQRFDKEPKIIVCKKY
jgi:hypothetical protein